MDFYLYYKKLNYIYLSLIIFCNYITYDKLLLNKSKIIYNLSGFNLVKKIIKKIIFFISLFNL